MHKESLLLRNKWIFLISFILILFLFGQLSSLRVTQVAQAKTEKANTETTTDIVVQDADSIKKIDMAENINASFLTLISEVPHRIVVEYGNSIHSSSLNTPPVELTSVSNNVTPRIIVEYGNSTYHHNLEVPPTGFTAISNISPRIVVEHANSNFYRNLIAASPDFTMSTTPVSQSINAGQSGIYTVSLTALAGFNSSVSLSASNLPTGATYSFSPSSLIPSGTSSLTINTSPSTPIGSYTVTITGTGGGITRTENIGLIVKAVSPSPPQNLTVTLSGNTQITLTWQLSAQGTYPIAGYAIYRGTTSGGESTTPIDTVGASVTTYTDNSVTNGTTYYYYVKAFDNQNPPNYSGSSNEVSATIPSEATFTLHIPTNWSVISVPFETDPSLFTNNANIQYLFYWDGTFWQIPTTLQPGIGYLVYNTSSSTMDITFTGTPTSSPFTEPATGNWQVIGNPFTTTATLTSTSTITYLFYWDGTFWQTADPNNLQPGVGYLILTNGTGTLTFTKNP